MACEICLLAPAVTIRPSNRMKLCKDCFTLEIENEVHKTIKETNMFKGIATLVIGVSGGKDSTVLAHIINVLNARHNYNLDLKLLCIDEGISGYRDKSIEVVKRNETDLGIPLLLMSYQESFGHTMDSIVKQIGRKGNCTYCGVFRRGSLENGAKILNGDMIATGHNADDMAETVLMNYLRGDISRLMRCTHMVTQSTANNIIPRCKPLSRVYEKEIVMYAFYNKLPYFSTECKYSPNAFRGVARKYIKTLEKLEPQSILNIIDSGISIQSKSISQQENTFPCTLCNKQCSNIGKVCQSCTLLNTLAHPK
ncbi:cytoplasmic tRNA 2-thiolation protein 1 [Nematocida sp. AWRm80]|nr:cytoplasmic tRNA 2-thiolation protein 1 [Nematocida sp. AWRm80]